MGKFTIKGLAAGVAAAALLAGPALADGARDLRDLIGARGSSGESALQARGYEHVETHRAGNVLAAYWWNEREDDCVLVRTANGRYQSITDASDQDCGHHEGAGAAVGAAAALGIGAAIVAALASGHDDDDDRDHDSRTQYDRGFNDGLHNAAYHNYDRSDAYSEGYEAGVRQREYNLSHRRGHGGAGGYQASVDVRDLNGARAAGAMSELERRGFRQVDNFTSGNTRYSIQWNARTRQCLQATIADGRIYDIRDIGSHPNCSGSGGSGSASASAPRIDWFPRLVGANAQGARTQLTQNGFESVFIEDGGRRTIYFNRASGQCLLMEAENRRVTAVRELRSDRRCR